MTDLTERVAIVTGAGGAIGRDVAGRLLNAGATVVAADIAAPDFGGVDRAAPVALDVTDTPAVDAAVTAVIEQHGRIDILVNVAGVYGHMARADRIEPGEWDDYLNVNLTGP